MTIIYQPKEVMEKLGFKDGVYKKYISALEKEGYEFHKNDRGHRIFTEDDLKTLETFVELIQYDGMTIEKVAKEIGKIRGDNGTTDSSHDVMALVDKAVQAALATQARQLMGVVSPQFEEIKRLMKENTEDLKEQNKKLIAEREEHEKKRIEIQDKLLMQSIRSEQEIKKLTLATEELKNQVAATQEKKGWWSRLWKK